MKWRYFWTVRSLLPNSAISMPYPLGCRCSPSKRNLRSLMSLPSCAKHGIIQTIFFSYPCNSKVPVKAIFGNFFCFYTCIFFSRPRITQLAIFHAHFFSRALFCFLFLTVINIVSRGINLIFFTGCSFFHKHILLNQPFSCRFCGATARL